VSAERPDRYLTYIHDSIQRVGQRIAGGREAFFADDVLQDAVIRRLDTLADATQHLPSERKELHSEIPWRTITDFRNRVVHRYLNIDLERVCDVIEADLPPLKAVVEQDLEGPAHEVEIEPW